MTAPHNIPAVPIEYPDSDGRRVAENTLQFEWIVTLQGGLDHLFRHDPDVFVAGELLWYAVEGKVNRCASPDVMVVFGRPKGRRGSYKLWVENGVAPQVVFDVLAPETRHGTLARKLLFYEKYGVEEYYVYDPDRVRLTGYIRDKSGLFAAVPKMDGYTSPRLGTRFDLSGEKLVVVRPDGKRFLTGLEAAQQNRDEEQRPAVLEKRLDQSHS